MTKKTLRRPKTRTKTLPYAAGKKLRKRAKRTQPSAEPGLTPRSIVHDAINELQAARRAFDEMTVHRFRGKHDLVQYDYIVFLESVQRVHRHLVQLDLDLPEGGAS